jgi:hypothetical protein
VEGDKRRRRGRSAGNRREGGILDLTNLDEFVI